MSECWPLVGLRIVVVALLLCVPLVSGAAPLGLPPLPVPPDNPQSSEKIRLGDKLFHDTRFSSTGEVACKNCHLDGIAFHDGRPVPRGVHMARGTRNAPTVINAAYMKNLFWDGRAGSLEEQSIQPLFNPVEHGLTSETQVLSVVQGDPEYRALFRAAFGVPPNIITMQHFAWAVAAYERTIISGNSDFDRWYYGGQANAISEAAKRGFVVFTGQGQCSSCHLIGSDHALFTDQLFHNANVGFARLGSNPEAAARRYLRVKTGKLDHQVLSDLQVSELGRFAVTERMEDLGAFITPGLRNIARTPPYLHDGTLNTLEKAVRYFNNGGKMNPDEPGPNRFQSALIRPLHLSERQQQDLVEFLKTLTSPEYMSTWE